jgi:hypothetical protein
VYTIPLEQSSLKELNDNILKKHDEANSLALPAASLVQITYNINRGKSPAMDDLSAYLPYPQRYRTLSQLAKLEKVDTRSAIDFLNYRSKLNPRVRMFFNEWLDGITFIAKN